jgi:hypothetical protein
MPVLPCTSGFRELDTKPQRDTASEIAATELPLLHKMEERAGGEEARLGQSPRDILLNRPTLSPALSRSFVAGEGAEQEQCTDAPLMPP